MTENDANKEIESLQEVESPEVLEVHQANLKSMAEEGVHPVKDDGNANSRNQNRASTPPIVTDLGLQSIPTIPEVEDLVSTVRREAPRMGTTGSLELDRRISSRVDPAEYGRATDNRPSTTVRDIISADYYAELPSGKQVARYQNYVPGVDNRERLAQMQTTGEKWGNSLKKFGVGVGAAVVGGTVGLVSSTFEAIVEGNSAAIHDNYFSNWAYELNEKNEYTMPVYTTKEYENKSLVRQMGTANFWAGDVLSGATFTVGMLASEAIWATATRGRSLVGGIGRLASGIAKYSSKTLGRAASKRGIEAVKTAKKQLLNETVKKQAFEVAAGNVVLGVRSKNLLNTGRQIYTSAFYEAQMEAKFFIEETREDFISEFEYRNGRRPSGTEMMDFEADLMSSANYVTAANIALVGSTNLMTFGRFMTGAKNTGRFKNNMLKRALFGEGFDKSVAGVITPLKPTNFQKVAGRLYGITKPIVSEGFIEEAGQSVIGTAANEYILAAYNPDQTRESISMIDSFYKGMEEAYGTKEGQKEILVGGIIGLLFGGAQTRFKFDEVSQRVKDIKTQAEVYNTIPSEHLMYNTVFSDKTRKSAEMAKEAARKGDIVGVEVANDLSVVAKIERDYMFGGVQQGVRDYRAYLETQLETIKDELGVDQATAEDIINQATTEYQNTAEAYERNRNFAEATFGNRDIVEFKNAAIGRETIVAAVATFLTIGKNADIRATDTINQIKERVKNELGNREDLRGMDTMEALRKIAPQAYRDYKRSQERHEVLKNRVDKIEQRLTELRSNRDANETEAKERENLLKEYSRITNEMNEEKGKKDAAYLALGLVEVSETNITQEDLDKQDSRLERLTKALERTEKRDPTLAKEIKELINEYQSSVDYAKTYSEMAEKLIDPQFRLTEINNWATKLFKGKKKLEEGYLEYFKDLHEQYYALELSIKTRTDAQAAARQNQEPEEAVEEVPAEKMEAPKPEEVQAQIEKLAKKLYEGGEIEGSDLALQTQYPQELETELRALQESGRSVNIIRKELEEAKRELETQVKEATGEETKPNTRKTVLQEEIDGIQSEIERLQEVEEGSTISTEVEDSIKELQELKKQKAEELERETEEIVGEVETPENLKTQELQQKIVGLEIELESKRPSENFISTQIRALRNKVEQLINSNEYTKQYLGEDIEELIKEKPSKKDIDQFSSYLDRLSKTAEEELGKSKLSDDVANMEQVLEEEGFSQEEILDFIQLNTKLGNWNVMDGVSENGTSITDLLNILQQYQGTVTPSEFKKQLTQRDYNNVKTAVETEAKSYDSASPLQTPDTVKAKYSKGNIEISHMEVTTLALSLGADSIVEVNKKGEESPLNESTMKEEGKTFSIKIGEEALTVRIGPHARLIINGEVLRNTARNSNIKFVDYGSQSKFDIYERVGETEEFIPMKGDFTYGNSKINYGAVDNLKPGERTHLSLDTNDPYNKKLINKYNKSIKKATEQEKEALRRDLVNNLHIYVTTENGEILGSLRAFQTFFNAKSSETSSLIRARENAASYIIEGGLEGVVDLEMSIPVDRVLLGSPNYTVVENESGDLVPNTIEFNDNSLKKVKAAGVWENGRLQLNRKGLENSSITTFLKGMEGIVPVIVFEHQGKNVVFPVSLLGEVTNQTGLIEGILSLDQSPTNKIMMINNLLVDKGINPADNPLDPTMPLESGENLAIVENILEQFLEIEDFPDVNTWRSDKFSLPLLKDQARIAIDLENNPLSTGKAILRLQELEISNSEKLRETIFKGKTQLELLKGILTEFEDLGNYAEAEGMFLQDTLPAFVEMLDSQTKVITRAELDKLDWAKAKGRFNAIEEGLKTPNRGRDRLFNDKVREFKESVREYKEDLKRYNEYQKVRSENLKKQIESNNIENC